VLLRPAKHVSGKGQAEDFSRMSFQHLDWLAGAHVPEPYGTVEATRSKQRAAGHPCYIKDKT